MANRSLPLANTHINRLMELNLRDEQAPVLPSTPTENKLYPLNSRHLQSIFLHEEQVIKNVFAIPLHEGDRLSSLQLYIKENSYLQVKSSVIDIWKLHEPIPWDRIDDELPVRCREISKFAKILTPGDVSKQLPEDYPPRGYLHVIVQLPKAEILSGPLADVDERIQIFFDQHGRELQKLISNARSIRSLHQTWVPQGTENDGAKKLANHLVNLEIPVAPYGQPSLLLHRIGEDDKKMDHIISEVFSAYGDTYVVNNPLLGVLILLPLACLVLAPVPVKLVS
ncbi:hypothetical protein CPB86DRAFT_516701, partial [Serendipita vermifera]